MIKIINAAIGDKFTNQFFPTIKLNRQLPSYFCKYHYLRQSWWNNKNKNGVKYLWNHAQHANPSVPKKFWGRIPDWRWLSHILLLKYPDKSYYFKNLVFMMSSLRTLFTRISIKTLLWLLGGKSCFFHTDPSNFQQLLQSLLLRYTAQKLQVT